MLYKGACFFKASKTLSFNFKKIFTNQIGEK